MSAEALSVPVREASVRATRWRKRLHDAGWACYGLGTASLGSAMFLAGLSGHEGPLPPWLAMPLAALALLTYLWPVLITAGLVVGRARELGAGVAHVSDGALVLDGIASPLRLARAEIAQAAVVPGQGLHLEDRTGRELDLAMGTAEAHALLEALALDPDKHRYRFAWRNRSARVWAFVAAFLGMSFVASLPMLASAAGQASITAIGCMLASSPWLVAELVSRWWSSRALEIGLDGVLATSRKGRALLRFDDVRDVADEGGELRVTTNDGVVHRLFADVDDDAVRRAMLARLREAQAIARGRGGEGSVALALLDRGSRTLGAWRAELATILTAAKGFRAAAVGSEELVAVMDDTGAPAEQRLAAAIALGAEPANRARVRVAAETSVSPRLRVALDAVADGEADDAVLEAALAEEAAEAEEKASRELA